MGINLLFSVLKAKRRGGGIFFTEYSLRASKQQKTRRQPGLGNYLITYSGEISNNLDILSGLVWLLSNSMILLSLFEQILTDFLLLLSKIPLLLSNWGIGRLLCLTHTSLMHENRPRASSPWFIPSITNMFI
ncbi:hypothetical protein [Neobacillus sp. SAB-20_R2A]|uniref:hypothetical protein n=1 Tax=Neobacillus sp. SAB-20_R2A TaxID=3120519 RepID=UPI003C6EA3C6